MLLSAFVELRLVLANSSWADIQAAIPDEAMFIETAKKGFAHYGLFSGQPAAIGRSVGLQAG